jgi:2-amino-4-hydroxy-6-hydroxymethyldihydropteridine diphosphokinase
MSEPLHRAYVGLGSNLDGPRERLERALTALDGLPVTRLSKASALYASQPVGPQDQPDFVNAVALLETRLSPLALLDQLQALEQQHRRQRRRHWGPRTLDLDLLLFDDLTLALPRLSLPHPAMRDRAFVLIPLTEIAPQLTLEGASLTLLTSRITADDVRRLPPH